MLLEMCKRFPACTPLKTNVTRAQRNAEDARFYHFISVDTFQERAAEGRFFQQAFFGGNYYGCDRAETDTVVTEKLGVIVLVQQSVADFRAVGYRLHVIEIIPEGHTPRNEAQRLKDDEARAKIAMDYDARIVNSFAPGGFKKAADELANIVDGLLKVE